MLELVIKLNEKVATDCRNKRHKPLHDETLDIRSLHKCTKQFKQMESHAFNTVNFTFLETFISNLIVFILLIFLLFICLQSLIIRHNFCEDWQVWIQKLPGRLQNEVDTVLREIDEVSEYYYQALQHVLLHVEVFLGVRLD